MKRIGPRMQEAVEIATSNPGIKLYNLAYLVAPTGVPGGIPGLGYGYRTVHRAVQAGLLTLHERSDKKGCYKVFPKD